MTPGQESSVLPIESVQVVPSVRGCHHKPGDSLDSTAYRLTVLLVLINVNFVINSNPCVVGEWNYFLL